MLWAPPKQTLQRAWSGQQGCRLANLLPGHSQARHIALLASQCARLRCLPATSCNFAAQTLTPSEAGPRVLEATPKGTTKSKDVYKLTVLAASGTSPVCKMTHKPRALHVHTNRAAVASAANQERLAVLVSCAADCSQGVTEDDQGWNSSDESVDVRKPRRPHRTCKCAVAGGRQAQACTRAEWRAVAAHEFTGKTPERDMYTTRNTMQEANSCSKPLVEGSWAAQCHFAREERALGKTRGWSEASA